MAHENLTESTPNNGNQRESGIVKGDSDEVWGNTSQNTIPINTSSWLTSYTLQNLKIT